MTGRRPRRGLVLGGGGVVGGAWTVGALRAIEQVHGLDLREIDLVIGTSAGAFIGALLAHGVSVADLLAHQLGEPVGPGPLRGVAYDHDTATGSGHPERPRWGPGSAELVRRNARTLRRLPPSAVLASLVPQGTGSLSEVGRVVGEVGADRPWPAPLEVTALDFGTGVRRSFGVADAAGVALADAVMASCAVPGWYTPVLIEGDRYVDGGAWSATNVDLAAGRGLDELIVVAPMVSFAPDQPDHWRERMERRWRERVTRRCLREVAVVDGDGTDVTVLGPGREDLQAFGDNVMSPDRRREVVTTSLRTSVEALSAPETLEALPDRVVRATSRRGR